MHLMAKMYQESGSFQEYSRRYFARVMEVCASASADRLAAVAELLDNARTHGNALYFIANGGSAATASHWVNDLVVGATLEGKPAFRAYCLTDNASSVTALGNDSCFENIFANQLKVLLRPGDVVFAMSVSGNSENIIRGVAAARECGAKTVGIAGMGGGRLIESVDIGVLLPSTADEYGPVEDAFGVIEHLLATWLTMKGGKWMHH